MDQKQQSTSLLIINTTVYNIKNPAELLIDVSIASIKHIIDEIPSPNKENGLLLIFLIINSATIYPPI